MPDRVITNSEVHQWTSRNGFGTLKGPNVVQKVKGRFSHVPYSSASPGVGVERPDRKYTPCFTSTPIIRYVLRVIRRMA